VGLKFNGSLPPFGYRRNGNKLELDPQYAPYVKEIFRLFLYEDWGLQRIAKHLSKRGIPTPRKVQGAKNAGELWQQSTVKIILTNPMYTGNMVQNRSKVISIRTKNRKQLSENQQTIVTATHEALVTEEEFEEVQAKLKRKGKKRSNGQESLFAHLAVCADCGTGMHYKNDRKAYLCGRYQKYGKTFFSHHLIKADKLLSEVLATLKELTEEGVKKKKLIEVAKKEAGKHVANHDIELKQIDKRIQQLSRKQSNLFLLNEGDLTKDEWKTQNELIREEVTQLSARKLELQSLIGKEKDMDSQIHAFEKQVSKLIHLNIEDEKVLKQVIHKLINKIEVFEGGTIKIHFNFISPVAKMGA
jgi:site-specific DNA recombinase